MKNTLIVQFPAVSNPELDRVLEIEQTLIQAYSQNGTAKVDGHDFGNGANIFLLPRKTWDRPIEIVLAYLRLKNAIDEVLIIKRCKNETYEVIWPENFTGEFEQV